MHKTKTPYRQDKSNQEGFVSLVVALTLIIILALLTVGFAQLSRREQRQALDKQLSVQAYYAAETGVNDIVKVIPQIKALATKPDKTICLKQEVLDTLGLKPTINGAADVRYTCVLVDLEPKSLVYTNVAPEVPHYTSFSTDTPMSTLTVQWDSPGRTGLPTNTGVGFLPISEWSTNKYPSVVEFSVTPYNPTNITQDNLIASQFTTYLYPVAGGSGTASYAPANSGVISAANCSAGSCRVNISVPASGEYLIHFLPRYATTNVTVTGTNAAGARVKFIGGQVMIDSTGKAQDVLKRIQVRVDPKVDLPDFAIEAQNICKRQETEPSSTKYKTADDSVAATGHPCYLSN